MAYNWWCLKNYHILREYRGVPFLNEEESAAHWCLGYYCIWNLSCIWCLVGQEIFFPAFLSPLICDSNLDRHTHHSPTYYCIFSWLCCVSLKHLYVPVSLLQSWSAWPRAKHPSIGPSLWDKHLTVSSSKPTGIHSDMELVLLLLFGWCFVGFSWGVEGFKLFCFVISPKFVLKDLELEISIMKTNER